jgi:hypothetical protein
VAWNDSDKNTLAVKAEELFVPFLRKEQHEATISQGTIYFIKQLKNLHSLSFFFFGFFFLIF